MRASIQKWGNSLAVRIPKSFALEAHLEQDTPVEISLLDGKITIMAVKPVYVLENLLNGVTNENLHTEQDLGVPVGNEEW